ncbi:unnamed protein product [Bemisia tabaci]|uniref:Major facilitator superfamily (MFS) profile domain-containing protein n=1 Tax=Bemisia tabaci TaxID=7038 RepID=A0A9P0G2T1_BEMTA|nr:unnamed protein product [Bemisia tabaci]
MRDPPGPSVSLIDDAVDVDEDVPVPTNTRYEYSNRSTFAQVLATIVQSWLLIDNGLMKAVPTLILGSLHDNPNEPLDMNDDQASWFGAIPYICTPITSFASGIFQEKFGRKGSMILVNIPIFVAWILLYVAESIAAFYTVAVIMGLSIGLSEAPLSCYIGETSEPHLRGTLATIMSTAMIIGYFIMYTLGYFFDWRTAALISSAFPIVTFVLMTPIPESSTWLIGRSRFKDAKKSLRWLRGWVTAEAVEEEYQSLLSNNRDPIRKKPSESTLQERGPEQEDYGFFRTQYQTLMNDNIMLPLRLVLITSFIGYVAVLRGMTPYLIGELNALSTPIDAKLVLIITQILFLLGAAADMMFLQGLGKRKIALFSHAIAAVCLLGIGFYAFHLQASAVYYPHLAWLPVIFLMVINFLGGFSLQVLPWQLMCEVFPRVLKNYKFSPPPRFTAMGRGPCGHPLNTALVP